MPDLAHELTDRELTALEKKIAAAYERAKDKVQERADYVGKNVPTNKSERISVCMKEFDGVDAVYLVK